MKCSDIIRHLERLAPADYACDWDNPGLLAGRSSKEVHRIMIALDATDEVIEQAVKEDVDLLLTHHPLIFGSLKMINDMSFVARRVVKLLRHDIACYAMHTNFDSAPGGMADLAAARLHLVDTHILDLTGVSPDGVHYGIGKVGYLPLAMSLEELSREVKRAFGLPFVLVYGMEETKEPIRKVAICPGSGRHMVEISEKWGAQALITGDIGHHDGIDAVDGGIAIIDGGHYGLEHIFIDFMDTYIREQVDGNLEIVKAPIKFPASVL